MLKWTASLQKLPQDVSLNSQISNSTGRPRINKPTRCKRRATIANKENIPILTSTPMANRTRNSSLVLVPLADILNVTPENIGNRTPERRRVSINAVDDAIAASNMRRHSSVGFTIPHQIPQYAATLPKYEEEYSPSTIVPTGQQLALRGLLPDPFMENPRYFTTPVVPLDQEQHQQQEEFKKISFLPKKRKLEEEFVAIAKEQEKGSFEATQTPIKKKLHIKHTPSMSNKMGDQTLDNLIDAILDSARKEEKKKKPRKSFNLRRRTLLKNQIEQQQDKILSPSYTAGDDPCSDVSFLNCESIPVPVTPQPATPPPGTPLSHRVLLELPTPAKRNDSFSLDTPVPPKLKRRSDTNARADRKAKKYQIDSSKYFEIGVALPSIYV